MKRGFSVVTQPPTPRSARPPGPLTHSLTAAAPTGCAVAFAGGLSEYYLHPSSAERRCVDRWGKRQADNEECNWIALLCQGFPYLAW
ncbi:hypothetical protein ILYODFUR_032877 [Ilyodon furcidens]|uniref:Uncharacterized protein n=1 Tax=Ilyodon furcidens TaxID=33524 RepID=A0ABV0UP06_9TELE